MAQRDLIPEAERVEDVVASLAVTLDGYVCRPDGSVDYLDRYPMAEFDFEAWVDRVGALVMGRTSYEQAVEWGWLWGDRPTLVLTHATDLPVPDGADVTFSATDTAEAVRDWSARTPKRLWVFGGGRVVTEALIAGAVDTLDLTVVPEAIGAGIPLFSRPFAGPMRVVSTRAFDSAAVRLVYDTTPERAG